MSKANEPAFPIHELVTNALRDSDPADARWFSGLTKREYFAALAMQGALAGEGEDSGIFPDVQTLANFSVRCADALLAELEKKP